MMKRIAFLLTLIVPIFTGWIPSAQAQFDPGFHPDELGQTEPDNATRLYGVRNYADGTAPDLWEEFRALKKRNGNLRLVPAANWKSLGPTSMDSTAGRIVCHAFNPMNSSSIWVGASSGGVWKTTDRGDTWTTIADDLPSIRVHAIAVNPQDTNHLIIGTGHYLSGSFTLQPGIGLLETTDGGATWLPNSLAFPFSQGVGINAVRFDPNNPLRLYTAASNGLWISDDGGQSWNTTLSGNVTDFEIVSTNTQRLFAGVHSQGVYRSDDGGQSWALLTNGLPASPNVHRVEMSLSDSAPGFVLVSIVDPTTFGATGVYKTSDGGDTWNLFANAPDYLCNNGSCLGWFANAVAVSPVDTNVIILGGIRLFTTSDGGQNWHWRGYYSTPLGGNKVGRAYVDQQDAGFDPEHPTTAYMFNDGGVYRSEDNGFFWHKKNQGLVTAQFYRIASFPGDTALMLGGIQDHGQQYLDNTGGNTDWNLWAIGDGCAVAFDPNNPSRAFGDNLFASHTRTNNVTGGLASTISFNNGITGVNSTAFHFVTVHHPIQSNVLYSATDNEIVKSTNGVFWQNIASIANVRSLAISPADPNVVYAATYNNSNWAFHVSVDAGGSWSQTQSSPGWRVTDVEGDPHTPETVYATRNSSLPQNPHVFRSDDFGNTWIPINIGLPDVPTWGVAVNYYNPDVLYVGTDLGVFISEDRGLSWEEYNDNLPPYYVMDLHYHPGDSTLRIGTLGRGVWKTKSVIPVVVGEEETTLPEVQMAVYPNPADQEVSVSFSLQKDRHVHVSVLNSLGQEITVVADQRLTAGDHILTWDRRGSTGHQVDAGIYYVRLQLHDRKMVRKVVLSE